MEATFFFTLRHALQPFPDGTPGILITWVQVLDQRDDEASSRWFGGLGDIGALASRVRGSTALRPLLIGQRCALSVSPVMAEPFCRLALGTSM
jgi:hypothetical protein